MSATNPSDTRQDSEPGFTVPLPQQLIESRMIDRNTLMLQASVNNGQVATQFSPNEDRTQWTGNLLIPANQQATLSILWLRDDNLPLASIERLIPPLQNDTTVEISAADYDSTAFDSDGDGIDNLSEVNAQTNPLDSNDPSTAPPVVTPVTPPAAGLDLTIPRLGAQSTAPEIDGLYDDVWNNEAQFRDDNNFLLAIDNLMIDQGAVRLDGNAEYQWATFHDSVYLYLFVFGEEISTATLNRDSDDVWNDDSISVFLDGDNSKLNRYDGVDDIHFIIPLINRNASSPDNPVSNSSFDSSSPEITRGSNSIPIDGIVEFATCVCDVGQHVWELRINLDQAGIIPGRAFGIEVQYDDDNDGGARDAKWGWKHPSRTTVDVDNTWENPSFMGTAVLE